MEALIAWFRDRKNLPVVLAGTAVVVLLFVLLILRGTGKIGGGGTDMAGGGMQGYPSVPGTTGMPAGTTGMPPGGTPGMPPSAGMPGAAPGMPGTVPGGMPGGVPGGMSGTQQFAGQAAAPTAAPATAKLAPMLPYRKDPFLPFSGRPTKSTVLTGMLPSIGRVRIAPAPVAAGVELASAADILPPQPFRRMAGALWNGKVSAILETDGQTDIVRPGMELTRGNSRVLVESIEPNCIILKTLDTIRPMSIKVNLAGSVAYGAQETGSPVYGPGAPSPSYPAGLIVPSL